jgi:hypothetical protein
MKTVFLCIVHSVVVPVTADGGSQIDDECVLRGWQAIGSQQRTTSYDLRESCSNKEHR